jgi:hypothetical protein
VEPARVGTGSGSANPRPTFACRPQVVVFGDGSSVELLFEVGKITFE